MSSTSNVQNLLVNVFRPVYTYDPTALVFTPRLELSNIDGIVANTLAVFTAAVGDSASNVYVGSNAGNAYTNIRVCCNVTALGFGAANLISNVSNSVYLGYNTGVGAVGANAVIAIGANATGNGTSNIFLGNGTGSAGTNNLLFGHGITNTASSNIHIGNRIVSSGNSNIVIGHDVSTGTITNTLRIGTTIAGNLSTRWVGIGGTLSPADSSNRLDVSGNTYISGNLGINAIPGDRTLDVAGNFQADDGFGVLDFSNGIVSSTQGYYSSRGTTGTLAPAGTSNIAPIKKGMLLVSAVNSATDYASYVLLATTTSNLVVVSSNELGASIAANGTNLELTSTAGGVYDWVVTYTPLP